MATQEFYIRHATENEARGPFNHEQLVSLAENSQIDPTTLYYDAAAEQWAEFASNATLMAQFFPEKKKLRLGTKEIKSLNAVSYTHLTAKTVRTVTATALVMMAYTFTKPRCR